MGKLGLSEDAIRLALRTAPEDWATLQVAGVALDPAKLALFVRYLTAISIGAVFMGANTYIGNGPNFMVKSIAEQSGVKMPSFFGYMVYSMLVLMPIFIVLTLILKFVFGYWHLT